MGAELSASSVGLLINTPTSEPHSYKGLCDYALHYMAEHFSLEPTLYLSSDVPHILTCYKAYNQAVKLRDYYFFHPETHVFLSMDYAHGLHKPSIRLDSHITGFIEDLNQRNKERIISDFSQIIDEITLNPYASDYCNQLLLQLLRIFANYASKLKYEISDTFNTDILYDEFKQQQNIHAFKDWFIHYIHEVLLFLERHEDTKHNKMVQKVQSYIANHLDKDISLDALADQIGITPRYLSKLFKDESGINFTSYLTQTRLETAEKLLKNTNLSVEQIGRKVGYNTPSYFIQKFKKAYGYTPNNYRKSLFNKESLN